MVGLVYKCWSNILLCNIIGIKLVFRYFIYVFVHLPSLGLKRLFGLMSSVYLTDHLKSVLLQRQSRWHGWLWRNAWRTRWHRHHGPRWHWRRSWRHGRWRYGRRNDGRPRQSWWQWRRYGRTRGWIRVSPVSVVYGVYSLKVEDSMRKILVFIDL